jgi:hypothetical protein
MQLRHEATRHIARLVICIVDKVYPILLVLIQDCGLQHPRVPQMKACVNDNEPAQRMHRSGRAD